MLEQLKAIPTSYNGYKFRSRLEARWAVFYDHLGIKYQYETEGFQLSNGLNYLPDFFLPEYGYWIEVKPVEPEYSPYTSPPSGDIDYLKISGLATDLNQDVYIAVGDVWFPYDGDPWYNSDDIANYHRPIHPGGNLASHHWWFECPKCGRLDLVLFGYTHYTKCDCIITDLESHIQWSNTHKLINAYAAARSARFEHGESPEGGGNGRHV